MIKTHSVFTPLAPSRLFVASIVILGLPTLVFASTNAISSSPSSPPASAYIEAPQSSVTTVTNYSTFSSNDGWSGPGYYHWPSYSGYNSIGVIEPRRYFFPPTAPALGEAYLRNRTKSSSLARSTIPLALSDYINEPFYAPLSPFLYEESLSKRRQKALDDYRTIRQGLVAELRAKLETLENADPAARATQLADFAQAQTPRVAASENTAYAIREELTHWGLFSDSSDWNEGRSWRLGDDTRWESTLDEAKVMRGAAFFQEGLSPAQRRLLREYAMELDDSGQGPTADMSLEARGPYLYFSPETSRILLPATLPAELDAKIAEYRHQKTVLKQELREVLYREDRRWFDSHRSAALRALAEKQAPQFAALETLAEEIRRGLEPLPNPAQPQAFGQPLPSPLGRRIASYMKQRSELQQALNAKLADLKRQFPTSRIEFVRMDDGFGIQVVANRKLSDTEAGRIETSRQALVPFNEQEIKAYANLVREKEAIRETLVQSAGQLSSLVTPRIVDFILRDYSSVLLQQELWQQYHDYAVAVLQPGLSPEQRRMLYDAALVKLDLQLPHYTY